MNRRCTRRKSSLELCGVASTTLSTVGIASIQDLGIECQQVRPPSKSCSGYAAVLAHADGLEFARFR